MLKQHGSTAAALQSCYIHTQCIIRKYGTARHYIPGLAYRRAAWDNNEKVTKIENCRAREILNSLNIIIIMVYN